MMTDITIRHATSEDKDDVMRIHDNVYGGSDYLPDYYDEFMACPNTTSYVAIMDEKIVGFTSMFLVDDGKTVISRASRVSPSVGGKGVYKYLHRHTLNETSAETVAFVADNLNEGVKKPSFQQEHTFLGSRPFSVYRVDKETNFGKPADVCELRSPGDEEWLSYFLSTAAKSYLFPMDRILVDWVPFRLLTSNIPLWKKNHRTRIYSDVTEGEDGKMSGLLSISTTIRVQDPPYECGLLIYGNDTKSLNKHIILHLRSMVELAESGTTIQLCVSADEEFDFEALDKVSDEIGLSKSTSNNADGLLYTHVLLFEKRLK